MFIFHYLTLNKQKYFVLKSSEKEILKFNRGAQIEKNWGRKKEHQQKLARNEDDVGNKKQVLFNDVMNVL